MQQSDLCQLIEKASEEKGSQRDLARWLDVSEQRLTEWKNGHRGCPPEVVASIAHAAKLDANQWLVRATLWKCEGKSSEKRAREALAKWWRVTGAALVLFIAPGLADIPRCIKS